MPAFAKCGICHRPIEASRWGIGACERIACETELRVTRPRAAAADYAKARLKRATVHRKRHGAQRRLSTEEQSTFRIAVLPKNLEQPSVLPSHRREALETHIRTVLADSHTLPDTDPYLTFDGLDDARSQDERDAEVALLGTGCASCRGNCCREGANHAYLTPETLRSYRMNFPQDDDETIVARYLGCVAEETMTHGCIYQHEHGCTLTPALRSYTCNAFFCEGMRAIRGHFEPGEPLRAYFVHDHGGRMTGGQFVEITVRKPAQNPPDAPSA